MMSKSPARGRGPRRDDEFRRQAVRLVAEEQYTFAAAAQAVGVTEQTLRAWHKKFAPPPAPCGDDATLKELQAENQRLRRELRRAELEREILKKSDGGCISRYCSAKESL